MGLSLTSCWPTIDPDDDNGATSGYYHYYDPRLDKCDTNDIVDFQTIIDEDADIGDPAEIWDSFWHPLPKSRPLEALPVLVCPVKHPSDWNDWHLLQALCREAVQKNKVIVLAASPIKLSDYSSRRAGLYFPSLHRTGFTVPVETM